MRKFLTAIIIFLSTGWASAQSEQQWMQQLQNAANIVRSNYQTSLSMIDIYQMANNPQGVQQAINLRDYHVEMYNYLESVAANVGQLTHDQQAQRQLEANVNEYHYRVKHEDFRPYNQIQPNLQQFIAQRHWEVSTPEGRNSYYAQQQQKQRAFDANQARHREANAQFDNYMDGLQSAQSQREKYHHQYVNTIHDRYEYVNPNNGQGYIGPNTLNQNPYVQNPDGSYTQLIPYQQY
jgi:hypothetical protein